MKHNFHYFDSILDASDDAILTLSASGLVLSWNRAAAEIFGYSGDEIVGKPMTVLAPVDLRERATGLMERICSGESIRRLETLVLSKDGRRLRLLLTALPISDEAGGVAGATVLYRQSDIDPARAADLYTCDEKYRVMTEQTLVGIYIIDDTGCFRYVNPYGAKLFGYRAEEVIGRQALSMVAEESRAMVAENLRKRLSGESDNVMNYEFVGLHKDGSRLHLMISSSGTDIDGHSLLTGVVQDVSEQHRVRLQIEEHLARIERMATGTMEAVSAMVELRDPYTAGHERRVGMLAAAIAGEMGYDENFQQGLQLAGAVHDVGKIAIPSEILTMPRRLTPLEYELVQDHAQQGYEILKRIESPWPIAEIARQHHERIDGSGYPQGLAGDEILPEARIMAVADVVESMTSSRPYRPGLGIEKALSELEANVGRFYDPQVVEACIRLFRVKGYEIPA